MIGAGAMKELLQFISAHNNYSDVFVLSDIRTAHYWMKPVTEIFASLRPKEIIIENGESLKTIDTCNIIWSKLMENNATRNSLLINLGGGVVTDLGGFVAAAYKRGIDFVNIPTTLLGMVDAAWGGKTGINFDGVKNQIGTFADPVATVVDVNFLTTISDKEKLSGYAEMIKHALIDSDEHWQMICTADPLQLTIEQVLASLHVKQRIVAADPRETGVRMALNFGHTFGHAIEGYMAAHTSGNILHGEAIAWGMVAEAYLSVQCEGLPQRVANDLTELVLMHYDQSVLSNIDGKALIEFMQHDKKNHDSSIRFSLLQKVGKPVTGATCAPELIHETVDMLLDLAANKQTI